MKIKYWMKRKLSIGMGKMNESFDTCDKCEDVVGVDDLRYCPDCGESFCRMCSGVQVSKHGRCEECVADADKAFML